MKTFALTLLPLALASCIIAPDAEPAVDAKADFLTSYIWRGVVQDDSPVIQGDVTIAMPVKQQEDATVALNVFANMPLSNGNSDGFLGDDNGWNINRADFSLLYMKPFKHFNFAGGLTQFTYPSNFRFFLDGGGTTSEVFGSFAFDIANLTPTVDVHYDFDQAGGFYINAHINYIWEWREDTRIEGRANLALASDGYAEWYYGEDSFGLADGGIAGTIYHDMAENLVISGTLGISSLLDNDDTLDQFGIDTSTFWLGVGANWSW